MDLEGALDRLLDRLDRDGVAIIAKDGVWHQHAIHWLLRVITLGGQSHYLDGYVTTLGNRIYVPAGWAQRSAGDRLATLEHERVHVQQFRRWGRLPMAIAYLLLPLPFGLAWCRMRLEREAYERSIAVHYEMGGRAATDRLRGPVIAQFTSGAYGWMWPFPRAVARWYDAFVARLEDGAAG